MYGGNGDRSTHLPDAVRLPGARSRQTSASKVAYTEINEVAVGSSPTQTPKTLFDSILDKVVCDLFHGGDRPRHQRIGAVKPTSKPRRPSFALEMLEPRLLLSADPVPASLRPDAAVAIVKLVASATESLALVRAGTATPNISLGLNPLGQ
jgi:hypothetical protein